MGKIIGICEECGKEFYYSEKHPKKYCGMSCYRKAQRSGKYKKGSSLPYIPCENCGKLVQRQAATDRSGNKCDKIFCNRKCYDEYRADPEKNQNLKKYKCKQCGEEFIGNTSRERVFCSNECMYEYRKSELKICPVCGEEFLPVYINPQGEIKHPRNRIVCSKECLREFYRTDESRKEKISKAFTGEKHPGWRGGRVNYRGSDWRSQKRKVVKRDVVCRHCGMTHEKSLEVYGSALEVHHITPFRFFKESEDANHGDNLILLCKSCHKRMEWLFWKEVDGR